MLSFPRSWRSGTALSLVVLLIGLLQAALAGLWVKQDNERDATSDFEHSVERVVNEISRRYRQPIYALAGVRGAFAVSSQMNRARFRAYVESRNLKEDFPGVRGVGFIQRVQRDELETFIALERADGASEFAIRQLQDPGRDDLYVIKYIEPRFDNVGAQGLDVGSNPQRRAAAQLAVDTGEPSMTAPITLVQDRRNTPGVLLFLPVYAGDSAGLPSFEERRQALVGLAYAPILMNELLAGVGEMEAGRVGFELFDTGPGGSPPASVYRVDGNGSPLPGGDDARHEGRREASRSLVFSGRNFTLKVHSSPSFDTANSKAEPWLVFGAGVIFSALLAWLLKQQVSNRARAEARARELTAELGRLAQVVKHTSNAVSITDRQMRITWVNEGFTRLCGYGPDEALGRRPGDLFKCDNADPATLMVLAASAATGTGCRVEILNRAKDGSEYWIETDIQPMLDDTGECIGFMEIGSDVTERRRVQLRLEAALRDTDALLSTLNMHAIVSAADASGRIIEVNDAFCRISGFSREELLGQYHRIVNSGIHDKAFWSAMWLDISSGAPWRQEVCNRAKNGELYWVDTFIAPFMGPDGKMQKYVSIRTDITASKRAERALASERAALANIIEGTNAGTWEWNIETGETRFNERWAQMLGYTLDELLPMSIDTWTRLSHPEDSSHAAVQLERHFNGEVPVYEAEVRMRHKQGHWIWALDRGKLFNRSDDGRPRWMAGTYIDITERKNAEERMRQSEAFSRSILNSISAEIAVLDRDGVIAAVNDPWRRFAVDNGLEPGQPAPNTDIGTNYLAICEAGEPEGVPKGAVSVAQGIRGVLSGRLPRFDLDYPCHAPEEDRWFNLTVTPLGGELGGVVVTHTDITERTMANIARRGMELELRRNNELMSSVLENLPCGLSVIGPDMNLVASNTKMRRLLGLPDSLFEGPVTNFEDIIRFNASRGDDGTDGVEDTVQRVLEGSGPGAGVHLVHRVRPDGTHLEIRRAPMPNGGVVTTYTDITARRKAEAEVQRSALLLRGAIDAVDEAFVLFDPDDRLVFCNEKYRRIYAEVAHLMVPGARFEDIIRPGAEMGQYDGAIGRVDDWVAERLAAHRSGDSTLIQQLASGRTLRIIERKMPDGHIVGFRIDITELAQATQAAQAASQAKSQFLANMSHEIRTPMNAVLGMLALLRRTELTPRQADYAHKTEAAARSLLGLLNEILDFSKVEAGKMTLDPQPFRIDRLLRDLSVILAANIGAKPVDLLFDIDPALPCHLVGDAMRLQQVLINLCGNAVKFTAQGEVVLSLAVLHQDAAAATVEISVRDSGIGIAPENQASIFSSFTQAEASTTRRYGGTGLGVAISHRLVSLMGGELRVESTLGQGSRFFFSVCLPVASDSPQAVDQAAAARHTRADPQERLRTMVIDDSAAARDVLERMIRSLGWAVDSVSSGPQALELLAANGAAGVEYGAIFVDSTMPGQDGWQTCARIRQLGLKGEAPTLLMVASNGDEVMEAPAHADKALLDGYLVRPLTASMVLDAVVDARNGRSQPHPSRHSAIVSGQRLAGMRLLVVEDNPNNQQVARELLEAEGAQVQMAGDGLEAVHAVATAGPPFDVVLMDLQMPVMDGFAATRRIREGLHRPGVPIVAMTANAMASDAEDCLAAGMNDHVGKPFDLDHLVRVLRRHAARPTLPDGIAEPRGRVAAGGRPPPATLAQAAAAAGVDIETALNRLGGHADIYRRTLKMFLNDVVSFADTFSGSEAQEADAATARALHTLKGLAGTLGAQALSTQAARGEKQWVSAIDAESRRQALQNMSEALVAAEPGLRALLLALQSAEADPEACSALGSDAEAWRAQALPTSESRGAFIDMDSLNSAIDSISALLRNADMAATEAMAGMMQRFGHALGSPLQAIEAAIGELDFDRALSLCQEMAVDLGGERGSALERKGPGEQIAEPGEADGGRRAQDRHDQSTS